VTIDATTTDTDMTPAQMNRTLERIYERSEDIWTDWIKLGRAIVERLEIAYRKAGNKRGGPVYKAALEKVMGAFHPNYKRLAGNGVISALESCIENYDAVEAFRTRAEVGDRLTSPKRVWAAFQESLRPPEAKVVDPDDDSAFQPHPVGNGKPKQAKAADPHGGAKETIGQRAMADLDKLKYAVALIEMGRDPESNGRKLREAFLKVCDGDMAAAMKLTNASFAAALGSQLPGEADMLALGAVA